MNEITNIYTIEEFINCYGKNFVFYENEVVQIIDKLISLGIGKTTELKIIIELDKYNIYENEISIVFFSSVNIPITSININENNIWSVYIENTNEKIKKIIVSKIVNENEISAGDFMSINQKRMENKNENQLNTTNIFIQSLINYGWLKDDTQIEIKRFNDSDFVEKIIIKRKNDFEVTMPMPSSYIMKHNNIIDNWSLKMRKNKIIFERTIKIK